MVSDSLNSETFFQLRPSSIPSSDQGSLLDPSPPYAISLHEYVTDHAYSLPTTRLPIRDFGQHNISDRREKPLILEVSVGRIFNLDPKDKSRTRSPFLVICRGFRKYSTPTLNGESNPPWNIRFTVPLVGDPLLSCVLWNKSILTKDYVGEIDINVGDIFSSGTMQTGPKWYGLGDTRPVGGKKSHKMWVLIQLRFALVDSSNAAASPREIYERLRTFVGAEKMDSYDTVSRQGGRRPDL